MNDSSKSTRGIVKGRVQGVGFRYFTRQEATRRGLSGWVLNRSDGDVEFHVEGPEQEVSEFLEKVRQGPRSSHVEDLQLEETETKNLSGFQIRY